VRSFAVACTHEAERARDLRRCRFRRVVMAAPRCGALRMKASPIRALLSASSDGHKQPQTRALPRGATATPRAALPRRRRPGNGARAQLRQRRWIGIGRRDGKARGERDLNRNPLDMIERPSRTTSELGSRWKTSDCRRRFPVGLSSEYRNVSDRLPVVSDDFPMTCRIRRVARTAGARRATRRRLDTDLEATQG
jgi:hypothetical protein